MKQAQKEFLDTLQSGYSPSQQSRLRQASVAIAGCGGLGSNIAVWLARTGIGRLHLVDFDVVEPSNLNRQQYQLDDIGQPKVTALANLINRINPYVEVSTAQDKLTEPRMAAVLGTYPIVAEAFDNPVAKASLVTTLLEIPCGPIVVAASGMASLDSVSTITTRRISSRLYICGDHHNDVANTPALLASRVAVCAGHQATAIVRLIIGEEP